MKILTLMAWILTRIIKAYQKISFWLMPRTCRYDPTCSQYALNAIQKYGAFKGIGLALIRILKCSPLCPGGYDPVK